jgi:uncharacterized protein YciI
MLFAFICIDKPDSADLRSRLRAEHIEYMIQIKDQTIFGGPLQDETGDRSLGSIFGADFPSRQDAEAFIADEPYTKGGLFESATIHRWRQMVPEPEEGYLLRELERQRTSA